MDLGRRSQLIEAGNILGVELEGSSRSVVWDRAAENAPGFKNDHLEYVLGISEIEIGSAANHEDDNENRRRWAAVTPPLPPTGRQGTMRGNSSGSSNKFVGRSLSASSASTSLASPNLPHRRSNSSALIGVDESEDEERFGHFEGSRMAAHRKTVSQSFQRSSSAMVTSFSNDHNLTADSNPSQKPQLQPRRFLSHSKSTSVLPVVPSRPGAPPVPQSSEAAKSQPAASNSPLPPLSQSSSSHGISPKQASAAPGSLSDMLQKMSKGKQTSGKSDGWKLDLVAGFSATGASKRREGDGNAEQKSPEEGVDEELGGGVILPLATEEEVPEDYPSPGGETHSPGLPASQLVSASVKKKALWRKLSMDDRYAQEIFSKLKGALSPAPAPAPEAAKAEEKTSPAPHPHPQPPSAKKAASRSSSSLSEWQRRKDAMRDEEVRQQEALASAPSLTVPGNRREIGAGSSHVLSFQAEADELLSTEDVEVQSAIAIARDSSNFSLLVQAMNGGGMERVRAAAAGVRGLTKLKKEGLKDGVVRAGGVEAMVKLLDSRDGLTVEHAVSSLLNLSLETGIRGWVFGNLAVERLVGCLAHESNVVKENAAAALYVLSDTPERQQVVGKSPGVISALLDLLRKGSVRGQKDASLALFNISSIPECRREVVRRDGVRILLDVLRECEEIALEEKVIAVLERVVKDKEGRRQIVPLDGVPVLVEQLENTSDFCKAEAVSILLMLAKKDSDVAAIIDKEAPRPTLNSLTRSGSEKTRKKAQELITMLRGTQGQGSSQEEDT